MSLHSLIRASIASIHQVNVQPGNSVAKSKISREKPTVPSPPRKSRLRADASGEDLIYGGYPDKRWQRTFRRNLLNWYFENRRELPWRTDNTAYRVWISEIMLQQTQIVTVIEYFERFMKTFPTIRDLAKATEEKVLSMWEGLGYYRRARNLHQAAKKLCEFHNGQFPTSFDAVIKLPGIGRYSAGAILSISNNQRLPILEGNTFRLHSRLLGLRQPPRHPVAEKLLWKFAEDILPTSRSKQRPGDFNQALMDLGSEICKPRSAHCHVCPVSSSCCAFELGLQDRLPVSLPKPSHRELRQALIIIENGKGNFFVRKRKQNEWWGGLWDFLRIDLTEITASKQNQELQKHVKTVTGSTVQIPRQPNQTIRHAVTQNRIILDCYYIVDQTGQNSTSEFVTKSPAQLSNLPLNTTARKFWQSLIISQKKRF
jgi:A/G-specific adenine glycosylase